MQLETKRKHFLDEEQAIVALCTPKGSGALALIRISGVNALEVAGALARLPNGVLLRDVPSHTIHYGSVVDVDTDIIDNVLFLVMHGPKTFTGQDTVEISCHNNPFIIDQIINQAIACGARLARAGEFSKRAVLNGKIDLLQAEAINELIHAPSESALKQSLATLQGSLSAHVVDIEKELTQLLGLVEASFEFLDEEQRDLEFDATITEKMLAVREKIAHVQSFFSNQKQIKDGVRIVLFGSVNAGKSTLFNALVGHERVLVSEAAGTTRDSVETSLYRNGNFWLLIDTAGIRETTDVIEQKGIERSLAEVAAADIVLAIVDASNPLSAAHAAHYQALIDQHGTKVIGVLNKIDSTSSEVEPFEALQARSRVASLPVVRVSAQQGVGIEDLEQAIEQTIQRLFGQLSAPFLLNQRQFKLLTEIGVGLEYIAKKEEISINYELMAHHLKGLLEKAAELTGRNVSELVLDTVFDSFCVGK